MRDDESALKAATKVTLLYLLTLIGCCSLTLGAVGLGAPGWVAVLILLISCTGSGSLIARYIIKKG